MKLRQILKISFFLIVSQVLLSASPVYADTVTTTSVTTTVVDVTTSVTTIETGTTSTTVTVSGDTTTTLGDSGGSGLLFSDEALRRLMYVKEHPIQSICNLFTSIAQRIHETVDNSKGMSVFFSLDRVVKTLYSADGFQIVLIALSSVVVISVTKLLIEGMLKLVTFKSFVVSKLMIVVPLIVVLLLNSVITSMSNVLLRRMDTIITANQINPKSYDVWTYNNSIIVTDEEIAKTIFREERSKETTLGDIVTTVETTETTTSADTTETTTAVTTAETIVSTSNSTENTTVETTETAVAANETKSEVTNYNTAQETDVTIKIDNTSKTLSELYELVKVPEDSFVYYTSDFFTPVHFERYDESVFYYFYDWITYQYYSYWANNQNKGVVIGKYTEQMKHPSKGDGDYLTKLQEIRRSMKYQSTNGLTLMYKDYAYSYNGEYVKDLFGLSQLFNANYGEALEQELLWKENCESLDKYCETCDTYYYPLRQLQNSKSWEVYSMSPVLRPIHGRYPYSVEYLTEYYANRINDFERPLNRVYGAFGSVENSKGVKNLSKFEMELNSLTEQMYKDVKSCCEELTGSVSDDTMIFCLALVCTYDFNSKFSRFSAKVEPTSLNYESVSVDTILKCLFRTNTETGSTAVGECNEFYFRLLDSSKGGIALVLIVSFWEIFLFLCIAMRILVLVLIVVFCIWLAFKPNKDSKGFVGLIAQCLVIIIAHCSFIFELLFVLRVFPNKHLSSVEDFSIVLVLMLGSLLILVLMFSVQFKMLVMFIQDPLNFGGQKIIESFKEKQNNFTKNLKSKKMTRNGQVIDETVEDLKREDDNHEFILQLLNENRRR